MKMTFPFLWRGEFRKQRALGKRGGVMVSGFGTMHRILRTIIVPCVVTDPE